MKKSEVKSQDVFQKRSDGSLHSSAGSAGGVKRRQDRSFGRENFEDMGTGADTDAVSGTAAGRERRAGLPMLLSLIGHLAGCISVKISKAPSDLEPNKALLKVGQVCSIMFLSQGVIGPLGTSCSVLSGVHFWRAWQLGTRSEVVLRKRQGVERTKSVFEQKQSSFVGEAPLTAPCFLAHILALT